MRVLVLNTGSSSVKYEVFTRSDAAGDLSSVVSGLVEGVGETSGAVHVTPAGGATETEERPVADHDAALGLVVDALARTGADEDLVAVGHRVVHGGEDFTAPTLLTDEVVARIDELAPLAPLHNPPAVAGIRVARRRWGDLPHVAVFDTAFHTTMPPAVYRYAVPEDWYREHGVRRFGFHGTSHRYVAGAAARFLDQPLEDLRLVTLHLGNGASACAIAGGRSVDTSMGLSPLAGLVMGTRSGDLDPGVVFHLVRGGTDLAEVERVLNRASGLVGLGGANDVRVLRSAAADGDGDARLALDVMTRRIRQYVGAYLAELGGLDALVFTAGIGEHDAATRAEVVEPLGHLGLRLDPEANGHADAGDGPVRISPPGVTPAVLVVATAEEATIAADTLAIVET
ncbi:acetate/propionate family kinase [Salsipaludibacter albus]|uniref:acetate/propionate family kinase n=1 Tax=Salsipaludibacter albus TaxID=2849650 RepID=UPI001EE405C9|nr:acetate kinase [Salsipaludibacter albus]MBY5161499.1 acetate kinase [Salsipaludibacter albus]